MAAKKAIRKTTRAKKTVRKSAVKKTAARKATSKKKVAKKKSASKKTAAKKVVRKATKKKAARKKAASAGKSAAKKSAPGKGVKSASKKAATSKKPATSKKRPMPLGRPKVTLDSKLEQLFLRDLEVREVCAFLDITTLRELEEYKADEIIQKLTAPIVNTVSRMRKALAMTNRCLKGDQKFAKAFKKQVETQMKQSRR